MKTISKALIAVMVAAAMCLVPLFAIADDSDAISNDSKGVSFEASSMSDDDYNKLASPEFKEKTAAYLVMGFLLAQGSDYLTAYTVAFAGLDYTSVTIKNVKDISLSKAMSIEDSNKIIIATSNAITCDISFTATYTDTYMIGAVPIFEMNAGTEALYKALGVNTIKDGDKLKFDGTMTINQTMIYNSDIAKNADDKYVATNIEGKESSMFDYSGTIEFLNFTTSAQKYDVSFKYAQSENGTQTMEFLDDVKVDKSTGATKVIVNEDVKTVEEYKFKYDRDDGKVSGEFDYKDAGNDAPAPFISATLDYLEAHPESDYCAYVYSAETAVPTFKYYSADPEERMLCLFYSTDVNPESTSIRSNDGMKDFLNEVGTAGDSFSDAKSIADSTYSEVSAPGSSGGNNLVFYIIIGVLAVAVVALAVILIKKK